MSQQQTAEVIYLKPEPDERIDGRNIMTTALSHRIGLVLHVDDTLGQARREDIERAVGAENGVESAHFTERRPHLMVIEYDPDLTSSTNILSKVNHQSVHAQLVGPV
jgi:hypothetical protein